MPIVRITTFNQKTKEEKEALARAITDVFINVGKSQPNTVHVIFDIIPPDAYSIGGKLMG